MRDEEKLSFYLFSHALLDRVSPGYFRNRSYFGFNHLSDQPINQKTESKRLSFCDYWGDIDVTIFLFVEDVK